MADPRTFKCKMADAATQSAARNALNAAGKIGDLNVLNSVGAGAIGNGLRTLVSASNSIRTGTGSLPTSIGSSLEAGQNWVFDTVKIPQSTVAAVASINSSVANAATGQAKQIFQKVKQGNFKLSDIPNSLQDLQNLERFGRGIIPTAAGSSSVAVDCKDSPYALDLVARAPKFKFLFIVQFIFSFGYDSLKAYDFAFVVKKSSRPSVKFAMDDVNYYNFRTKVMTRTEFEEMSMTFHDDNQNNAMAFYNAYRNAMSPITNMDDSTFFGNPEGDGMSFDAQSTLGTASQDSAAININTYTASRGPLLNDNTNVVREIKLYHIFDYGQYANIYQFLNPRMTSLDLDDVDMAISEGNEVSVKFNYDTVYIQTGVPVGDITDSNNIMPGQDTALYPLRNNISPGPTAGSSAIPSITVPAVVLPVVNTPSPINTQLPSI